MGTGEFNTAGNPAMGLHPIHGGVETLLVASCYRNRDKLRPDGPLGSYADFTPLPLTSSLESRCMINISSENKEKVIDT